MGVGEQGPILQAHAAGKCCYVWGIQLLYITCIVCLIRYFKFGKHVHVFMSIYIRQTK